MIKLTIDELRLCTCKKHYEERCRILYKEGKIICWAVDKEFQEPKHCIVCMEEGNEKLREANFKINEKRMLLIRAVDAAWKYIDNSNDITLEQYRIYRNEVENG